MATIGSDIIAIAYADSSLHVHSKMGSRLLPPLQQDSAITYMSSGKNLIYVTLTGVLKVIDIKLMKIEVETSILGCLVDSSIIAIHQKNNKLILITTKDKFLYTPLGWVILSPSGHSLDTLEVHS